MKIETRPPQKSQHSNNALLKQRLQRTNIERFKENLIILLDKISVIEKRPKDESEEHLKNDLRDFLRDTYYKESNAINTKDKKDLVIHLNKTTDSEVGVIIEAKRPTNVNEMITADNPNKKALHELILYYMNEREKENNNQLKHLIITNVYEWYIFDANYFDKHIYRNSQIKRLYDTKNRDKKDNPFFYEEIAKIIPKIDVEMPCTYFNIRDYETALKNKNNEDDKDLIALQKILSPFFLLKAPIANDSNSLNEKFYKELLHIIGLEEVKDGSKIIIRRREKDKQAGSLIENSINIILTEDSLYKIKDKSLYGQNKDEQIFNIALELSLTWINRILFLKLLEGQLISYHRGDKNYRFLNSEMIPDFDELYKLFHQVLARDISERSTNLKQKYSRVPYLNSSLFEISELEDLTIKINSLDHSESIELINNTILKEEKKKSNKLPALEYIFKFLDSYDFSSEGEEVIAENNRSLINASVLGKVFEKINGYKDGAVFTPAFITMYMSRESLRIAVTQKFNEYFIANKMVEVSTFDEIENRIDKIGVKTANEIINSLRICDPAVGSGHFLVSILNELIVIKSKLRILVDKNGKRLLLSEYEIDVVNDELIIKDENGIFKYNYQMKESQRVQETIFNERKIIIENCLFGVDINSNSVKICRLRLWIELLKSSYYKAPDFIELETLPNIDINIKCGNSLISRYALDSDLKDALKKSKLNITSYRLAVVTYQNAKNKDEKKEMEGLINEIKSNFKTEIQTNDPKLKKIRDLELDLIQLTKQEVLFERSGKELKEWNNKVVKLTEEIENNKKIIEEIKSNAIYKNAFEWRFEFPEVLDDKGDFVGFDLIIANPPYVDIKALDVKIVKYLFEKFKSANNRVNLYSSFIEKSLELINKNVSFSLIIPSSLLTQESYKDLRHILLNETTIERIIRLPNESFGGSSGEVKVDTIILSSKKGVHINQKTEIIVYKGFNRISKISPYNSDLNFFVNISDWKNNKNYIFRINTDILDIEIINKCQKKTDKLINCAEFCLGLTPYDKYKGHTKEQIENRVFHSITQKDNTFKKLLAGNDIRRYSVQWGGKEWIKYGNWLGAQRENRFFTDKRILIKQIIDWTDKRIWAALTEEELYNTQNAFNLIPKKGFESEYLISIINSKLLSFYHRKEFLEEFKDRFQKILIKDAKEFPIKILTIKEQQPFINLVKLIIKNKKQNIDTSELENQIDLMVYKLYELTYEEVKIVDPEFKLSEQEYQNV